MSISFAATPQSKEAQQARTYTDPSAGAPPSRRSGSNAPYIDKDHWNRVFTEPEYFDSIAKQKGMAEGAKVSLHGDDYVYRQAMIGYMAATRGVPLDDMRQVFDAEKDSFAKKVLGKQTASARELFDWQKGKFERDNEKQGAARQIMEGVIQRSLQDALSGGDTPFVESVAKDIDAAGDFFDEEEKSRLWEKAEELDQKIRATQSRFAPEARFIFDALQQSTGQREGWGTPDMAAMAGRFANLPDAQRKAIYELVGGFAQITKTDKEFFYQLAESLGRGVSDIVERVPRNAQEQALRNDLRILQGDQPVFRGTGIQGEAFSAAGTTPLTPEERAEAAEQVRQKLGVFKVERELRDLAERVVDPLKMVSVLPEIVEEGLYGAARSIPYTAVAAVPIAGVPAVAAALYSSNYDQIMLEHPDIDPDKAALIAAISAPIEAGLERMKVNTLMGRLPFFTRVVKRLQHPNQRNITRIAIGGAGIMAEQNAQEILQNAAFPFVQTIAAALDKDMPAYDWEKRIAGMPRELAVQFVALLPLSLIGAGALYHREMTRGADYVKNKANLERLGFKQEQIDRITGAATSDEAAAILREEYAKRDPKLVKEAAKRVVDEVLAVRQQQAPASLPRIERQGAEYVVLQPDGTVITRSTDQTVAEQALVSSQRQAVQREMGDVQKGITFAMDFLRKVSEARQRGEDVAQLIRESSDRTLFTDYEANPSQNNLDRLFETARNFGFDPKEPEDLKMFPVIGSNQGALREGIWRSIIRINDGADGTIVMREFAQDNLKRAVAEGRVTMDWVRSQLNDILPRIESDRIERRLRTETDTDVIEAFSDVALAYFRGQIKDDQIPDGLRGFFRRMAIIASDIFRRAYNLARLRAEGRLDRDFEALLAESVGVDQQALVDRSRERTEQEVGAGQNYSIGVSSTTDADYLAAVERGDMETAQRMVDEAARMAGYTMQNVYHASYENFDEFLTRAEQAERDDKSFDWDETSMGNLGEGFYFTPDLQYAKRFGNPRKFHLKINNIVDSRIDEVMERGRQIQQELIEDNGGTTQGEIYEELMREMGADGAIAEGAGGLSYGSIEVLIKQSNQAKLADPVTYDASGNVIPLSQRFDAGTANINYSIVRSVEHLKNDTRFDKLVKDGRVFTGVDVNDFTDMHILLHSPDNAFAGTIQLTDGGEIKGKGGVYYPALYADDNYFWASTEAMVMRTANHLNEIGEKNGGTVLMGLVSAPVEKLFSSTSMATGVVKFLNALTTDSRAGLSKDALNAMLVAASKVEVVVQTKTKTTKKTFSTKLKASDSYAKNFAKIDTLLAPDGSIFQVRKAFVESLAEQVSKHLNANKESAAYVAGILADAENKHAKSAIKRGTLSKASFLQGLGNMFTEPFLRDFQEHGSGKIYAVLEVKGKVKGIATTEHESYPATIVPVNKRSKVKLHVLKEAVDWQDVVGKDTGEYSAPAERLNLLPTSGMSSTSLKVLGVKSGTAGAPLNYSISTQSEIDRVSAAMGALDRSPLNKLKVYEKAQERFLRVMAENRETLAAMEGGDLSQVRRTQILQALGELDGILSALPAELRSKIGGYTQLARIDPMDVYKGDQKVSEVRGMSGAIISAWMREGLNIGEAQKKTALPDGYRAERNLDPQRADRALADVFIQRINRINEVMEKFLRDEYNDAAVELFKRAKPQRSGAGEKPKGKLGADVHSLFDTLKEATEWSAEQAQAWADGQWARIEAGELNPYEETHAMLGAQLVPLFADWANADSSQRAAAVTMGKEVLDRAYKGEQQRIIAQRTKRGYDRTDLSEDAGVSAADDKARQERLKTENSLPSQWESGMLNLVNFDQLLSYIFGRDSKVATELVNRQRLADNAKSDGIAELSDDWASFITQLGGGVMEGQQLVFDMSRMNDAIDDVPYSQNQLIAITMMWMQPKGRQHMEGFMDSDGQPAGKWHYNQDFVNKAERLLTPQAKAIRQYLLDKYDAEYNAINKVYRKVYGMNLPKNQFYSPLVVESIAAPAQAGIDPVTGAVFGGGSNSPSALRSRGGAIAQPVFRDAVQTYFGHMLQMEHWKAYAEFNSELSALLGHRDTRNVVKGKAGEQAATVLQNWLQYFQQGGNRDAANHLAINQWLNRMTSNFASIALFGRVSTLALQVTQLGAASAKMPVGAYLSRFGKLLSGRLGWGEALKSDYIQRRIKDMPPAVALAMQGLNAKKPSAIRNAARWLGQHLSGFDGFFTAGTYAIVYDYQLSQARQNGMTGQDAEAFARAEAERITDEIAQPTRAGARSIFEINSTNPIARAAWAFSSESRKNMGLLLTTGSKGAKRDFGRALTYVLLLNGLVGVIIRSAFRDMRDDDDDEWFDEKNWGAKRLLAMMISDPLYGFPIIGEAAESAILNAFGIYKPSGPMFDFAPAVPAAKRLAYDHPMALLEGEAEFRDIVRDVNRILSTAGLFNSTIAGAASISNLVKDAVEVGDNALGE